MSPLELKMRKLNRWLRSEAYKLKIERIGNPNRAKLDGKIEAYEEMAKKIEEEYLRRKLL